MKERAALDLQAQTGGWVKYGLYSTHSFEFLLLVRMLAAYKSNKLSN